MKWIKKAGFSLLFTFSLGTSVSTNAMQVSKWLGTDQLATLSKTLKEVGIGDETIQKLIDLVLRLEKSGLAVIAQLTTGLDEAIQGSQELIALNTIQGQITSLIKKIQEFKATSKSASTNTPVDKQQESKRSAAADKESKEAAVSKLSLSAEPTQVGIDKKFITEVVQPVVQEIDETLKNLRINLKKRINDEQRIVLTNLVSKIKNIIEVKRIDSKGASAVLTQAEQLLKDTTSSSIALQNMINGLVLIFQKLTAESNQAKDADKQKTETHPAAKQLTENIQETSALSSLEDKEKALSKIIGRLTPIHSLLSPDTILSPAISITDALVKELTALHKEILENIKPFKGGLAGVLGGTIKDLTEGLSSAGRSISTNIAEDLQRNLRATMGSPEMIKIIENIDKWHTKYRGNININLNIKQFIEGITEQINALEDLTAGLRDYHLPTEFFNIQNRFKDALKRYQQAIQSSSEEINIAAAKTLHESICATNRDLLDYVQGTLANTINILKKVLFDTVDKTTNQLKYRIDENIENFHTGLRETVNTDLPRTLKKGVGYLALGTIAACAMCHIIWHDLPWQGHLKNIGIATGSIIGMFLVDPVINWWSRPRTA